MTALNVFQFPGVFYMCSDTASYSNKAFVTGLRPKIHPVPAAKSAIGSSGSADLGDAVSYTVRGARSLNELLPEVRAAARRFIDGGICAGFGPFTHSFVVAGFSDTGEQQLWEMRFRPAIDQVPEFSLIEAPFARISPLFSFPFCESEVRSDPERFCRGVLERQRSMRIVTKGWNDSMPTQVVGGDGVLVVVTPYSIVQKVIVSWPDAIGRRMGDGEITGEATDVIVSASYAIDTAIGKVGPITSAASMIPAATGTAIGNMTGNSGLAAIFNGVTSAALASSGSRSAAAGYAGKDYSASPKTIDHVVTYGSSDNGYRDGSGGAVNLSLYGKNGSAPSTDTDGTLLGSTSTTDSNTNSQTINSSDTTTAWDYVWVKVTGGSIVVFAELQFYTPGVADNMTVVTTAQTTDNPVSKARVLFFYDPSSSPILNTDITAEVTCDGGANWSMGTLTLVTAYGQDGHYVVETEDVDCTPGTSFASRVTTANNKAIDIYGLCVSVTP